MGDMCKAIIEFGDDHGDNTTTFHCDREAGHAGSHHERGKLHFGQYYELWWTDEILAELPEPE